MPNDAVSPRLRALQTVLCITPSVHMISCNAVAMHRWLDHGGPEASLPALRDGLLAEARPSVG